MSILALARRLKTHSRKAYVIRDSKILLFERLTRTGVVGQPVTKFPGIESLADVVIDESKPNFEYVSELATDQNGTPLENCRIYGFNWDGELEEGKPTSFGVITSDGLVVKIHYTVPAW